jgi:hypothetical protein
MNAMQHCRVSQKRWGGQLQDYYAIHDFIDSTKELCTDSRHRILHTMWAVKNVVVPIFGHTLVNSDGKNIDIKDMCERDHLLVDFHNKYIPTLGDFVSAIEDVEIPDFGRRIEKFHQDYAQDSRVSELILSPLAATGQLKSLLLTHNSWFINSILPKVFNTKPIIANFDLSPSEFFNAMRFELWMDNGLVPPPSARKLTSHRVLF